MPAELVHADRERLVAQALGRDDWYHTLELAPGQATRGRVDLRSLARDVLPDDLAGRRTLDIGTFDGFWAYELERRGAEVVATDLAQYFDTEWPPPTRERLRAEYQDRSPSERFGLAHEALGSSVTLVESSVYDLDAERLGGPFDIAVIGWLLLHLRDPVAGLEAARRVITPGGRLLVFDQINLAASILRRGRPWARLRALETPFDWWVGNVACLRAWLTLAGFSPVHRLKVFRLDAVKDMRQWCIALEAERN